MTYSSVGETLIKNSNISYSPGDIGYQKYCSFTVPNTMFCNPVTEVELTNIIAKLNNNKAAGPDNIGPALLKEIAPGILHPFLHIINLSFSTGVFPNSLKTAKVIPVYKKREHCLTQNYRPISLLSLFHKILEKLMVNRWFTSYLCNRMQFTSVNGCSSSKLAVPCGIPKDLSWGHFYSSCMSTISQTLFLGKTSSYLQTIPICLFLQVQ